MTDKKSFANKIEHFLGMDLSDSVTMCGDPNSRRGRNAKTESTERNSEGAKRRKDENEGIGFRQVTETRKMSEVRKSL